MIGDFMSKPVQGSLFKKFRDVSFSTMISVFATALAQGTIGAIGFMIVGIPAFFPGVAMGFLSMLPYVGTALIWFPIGVYLLVVGNIWQGVFMLVWGAGVVSLVDNGSKIVYEPLPKDDPTRRQPDISQAREVLGWEPNISLDEGLPKTVKFFEGLK